MSVDNDIETALRDAGIPVFQHAAPQHHVGEFVAIVEADADPLNLLAGYSGLTRTDYSFECWAPNAPAAAALRSRVQATIDGSSLLRPYNTYELPVQDASAFSDKTDQFMKLCAFSFWHRRSS